MTSCCNGWRGLLRQLKNEVPQWGTLLPQLPRKLDAALSGSSDKLLTEGYMALMREQKRQNALLSVLAILVAGLLVLVLNR